MTQTSDFNFQSIPSFPRKLFPKDFKPALSGTDANIFIGDEIMNQHEPGAKLDHGKPRVGLVLGGFSKALLEVAKVGTFGADKYTDNGWKEVDNGLNRYTDAMYRHLLAEAGGEASDPESGLPHAAHVAWNALARLWFLLPKKDAKQEYPGGPGGYRFNPNDIVGGGS